VGSLGVGTSILGSLMGASGGAQGSGGEVVGRCKLKDLAPFLNASDGLGNRPQTIVTDLQFGPELLYRTEHRVLATPYHRNAQGILDAREILASPDMAVSLRLATERGVDLVLLCPSIPSVFQRGTEGQGGSAGLGARLEEGRIPSWLHKVEIPIDSGSGFLLFGMSELGHASVSAEIPDGSG